MPLPTTNLTAHFNASDNDNLWQNWQAGSPFFNTAVNDGDPIGYWNDEQSADLSLQNAGGTDRATWRSSTPLMPLPCVDFDGSNDRFTSHNDAGTSPKRVSDLFSASAYTALLSIYIEGASANNSNAYDNHTIFGDDGAYMGLFVRISSGQPKLQLYNWDGNQDLVEIDVSLNTPYVVMCRHESGNLFMSVNGGSESSTASGNTSDVTGHVALGRNLVGFAFYNGRIGEVAFYNAALTGSDLSDAISYFTGRWLDAEPPAAVNPLRTLIQPPLVWERWNTWNLTH